MWHPFYEVKVEEEDFKDKLMKQRKEKREADMMVGDIAEIEGKLKSLEEKERQEQQQALEAQKKPTFNLKQL